MKEKNAYKKFQILFLPFPLATGARSFAVLLESFALPGQLFEIWKKIHDSLVTKSDKSALGDATLLLFIFHFLCHQNLIDNSGSKVNIPLCLQMNIHLKFAVISQVLMVKKMKDKQQKSCIPVRRRVTYRLVIASFMNNIISLLRGHIMQSSYSEKFILPK